MKGEEDRTGSGIELQEENLWSGLMSSGERSDAECGRRI
jgi:hypothetical protein